MNHIAANDALAVLTYGKLIAAMSEAHRGERAHQEDLYLEVPGDSTQPDGVLARAAWHQGKHLGLKMATVFPANLGTSRPSVHAVYVLFDGSHGEPLATIDGTVLTHFKTACDSALGTSQLARHDATRLTMVGAGAMAIHLIKAHIAVRPSINHVTIWNRTPERGSALAQGLREQGIQAEAASDLETAVRRADVVTTATMTAQPLISGEWLQPGTHIDLVGSYTPRMREVDDRAIAAGTIFVDLRKTALFTGELAIPISRGVINTDAIAADHYDLASGGHPGRTSQHEITIFKNGGGGHLDLMTASHIFEAVKS